MVDYNEYSYTYTNTQWGSNDGGIETIAPCKILSEEHDKVTIRVPWGVEMVVPKTSVKKRSST